MKRILVLIMAVLCATFCSADANNKEAYEKNNEKETIVYESGIYHNKNWSETIGTYSERDVIPDKETALKMAKAIFDGMDKSEAMQEYVPQVVFYDTQDEIWIVSFWEDWEDPNQITIGGDCSIAMQKKDGKVLRIWFGE